LAASRLARLLARSQLGFASQMIVLVLFLAGLLLEVLLVLAAVGSLELELAPLFRNGDESGPETALSLIGRKAR